MQDVQDVQAVQDVENIQDDHEDDQYTMDTMPEDKGPKTAYELAMERLKKNDVAAGVERQPVTDAQKAAIAELRNFYESKLAELEVLHQGRMRAAVEPGERDTAEQEYRRDRERLTTERDAKIEKARRP